LYFAQRKCSKCQSKLLMSFDFRQMKIFVLILTMLLSERFLTLY
jgi:hypothetical protein